VEYLEDNKDRAVQMFRQARRFEDSRRDKYGVDTGMDRMIRVARGTLREPTPQDLSSHLKSEKQKTCVQLADLALLTFRPSHAEKLYDRLLAGEPPFPTPSNTLKSYLVYRLGQALKFQGKREDAYKYLKQLYRKEYSGQKWAAGGVSSLGTWLYNATQDAETAMPHWKHVFTEYPEHPAAERSLYFYGTRALDEENYQLAKRAFELFLKRYPDTECARAVRNIWLRKARNKEQYGE
jgi:tetratricopeptide (TPR) repeat protein